MMIYIKTNEGRRIKFPLPMSLVRFGLNCGNLAARLSKRYVDEDTLKYIESVDFKMLSKSMVELKKYKGLKLVDIKSKTGEEVTIIV
jgi:hypothetical protein